MRNYELVAVLPEGVTNAKKKATQSEIEKIVKAHDGKITSFENFGEHPSGVFLIFQVELDGGQLKDLDIKLKLSEDIKRYLVIKDGKKS